MPSESLPVPCSRPSTASWHLGSTKSSSRCRWRISPPSSPRPCAQLRQVGASFGRLTGALGRRIFARANGGGRMALEIRQVNPHFAAEIGGIDLNKSVDGSMVDAIWEAIDRYAVLVFRNQRLDDTQLRDFAAN